MTNKFNVPLLFFDLESTGTSVSKDRIVSICCKKIMPDNTFKIANSLINPQVPIPASATEVHGISDEMVAEAPKFSQLAKSIFNMLDGSLICGFNSNNFDVIMLAEEFARCGINWPPADTKFIDSCTIFKKHEERTLTAAMKFYCDKSHDGAHEAEADVNATIDVLNAQLERYDDIKDMTIDELHNYCIYDKDKNNVDLAGKIARDEKGELIFNFGKNLGKRLVDDIYYCEWMLKPDSDFTLQTKRIVEEVVNTKKGLTQKLF